MIRNSACYVKVSNARDRRDGSLLTNANATLKVIAWDKSNVVIQAETVMTYVTAGTWEYTIVGTAFVAGADPWTIEVRVYDQAGTALYRKQRITENDGY